MAYFYFSFNSVTISRLIEINNQAFGGNRPNVTKVYITHGELDPYRSVGVLEPFGDEIYVDIIPSELFYVNWRVKVNKSLYLLIFQIIRPMQRYFHKQQKPAMRSVVSKLVLEN